MVKVDNYTLILFFFVLMSLICYSSRLCMICSSLAYSTGLLKGELDSSSSRSGGFEKTALFFHKKDLGLQSHEYRQLMPFVG